MGKNPSIFEKLKGGDCVFIFRCRLSWLSSMAKVKPRIVINRAVIFMYGGIVIWGMLLGVIRLEIRNPAKILPSARRLMELMREGLFSLMIMRAG